VALTQAQKAAILLMTLDPSTAAELLKSARPETVTQIAAELAWLRESDDSSRPGVAEPVNEFFQLLRKGGGSGQEDFVQKMIEGVVGKARCPEVLGQVRHMVQAKDPFLQLRSAQVKPLAMALGGEAASVAAMVLGELSPAKAAQLLPLLDEAIRPQVIATMTAGQEPSIETRIRVATVVQQRLSQLNKAGVVATDDERRTAQLRKVAVLLRGLALDGRNALLSSLEQKDPDACARVKELMVTWDDVAAVADRALQEVLRGIDSRKLALSLVNATDATVQKIRSNMSERASAMLDEEASLLASPKDDEIVEAREGLLKLLREMNESGSLSFEEGQA
jgi:flagellar motor switch protein FliG